MARLFKTRSFARWFAKTQLEDKQLSQAVFEMQQGLIDADLGGGVVKKRVALIGRGKRGGIRTLVATNWEDRWFFVFGFEKNERGNISSKELDGLKKMAEDLLTLDLARALSEGVLEEIGYDDQGASEKSIVGHRARDGE